VQCIPGCRTSLPFSRPVPWLGAEMMGIGTYRLPLANREAKVRNQKTGIRSAVAGKIGKCLEGGSIPIVFNSPVKQIFRLQVSMRDQIPVQVVQSSQQHFNGQPRLTFRVTSLGNKKCCQIILIPTLKATFATTRSYISPPEAISITMNS
jgi:hypothetical protein